MRIYLIILVDYLTQKSIDRFRSISPSSVLYHLTEKDQQQRIIVSRFTWIIYKCRFDQIKCRKKIRILIILKSPMMNTINYKNKIDLGNRNLTMITINHGDSDSDLNTQMPEFTKEKKNYTANQNATSIQQQNRQNQGAGHFDQHLGDEGRRLVR